MGEAKRRKDSPGRRNPNLRSWAVGQIVVVANDVPCFSWQGTRQDAAGVGDRYFATMAAHGFEAVSFAKRAAGYLMAYGMPEVGGADRRPANHGHRWDQINTDIYRDAILWLALREAVPSTGKNLGEVFIGKALTVMFTGDKQRILDDTVRELSGQPFSGEEFQMMVTVADHHLPLDPKKAVPIPEKDLWAPASFGRSAGPANGKIIYAPRVPVDADEAKAMLAMITVTADLSGEYPAGTDPASLIRTYAGYTDDELRGGRPAVQIR